MEEDGPLIKYDLEKEVYVKRQTRGETHVNMEDWGDAATSQGRPRSAREPLEAGRGKEGFPYAFQRQHGPANPLISNFQPPEL